MGDGKKFFIFWYVILPQWPQSWLQPRPKEGEFKVPEAPVRRDKQGNKIDKMLEDAKESAENEEERIKLEKFMMYSKG